MYEPGQMLTLCYELSTRTSHGLTPSYRTRDAETEKKHNANNALYRSLIHTHIKPMLPRYAIGLPLLTLC